MYAIYKTLCVYAMCYKNRICILCGLYVRIVSVSYPDDLARQQKK